MVSYKLLENQLKSSFCNFIKKIAQCFLSSNQMKEVINQNKKNFGALILDDMLKNY
jgi:hypothetical protein